MQKLARHVKPINSRKKHSYISENNLKCILIDIFRITSNYNIVFSKCNNEYEIPGYILIFQYKKLSKRG